ncbi:hypothetical protein MNBD_ALPHA04-1544 [hydrothermal vent metagenome]|uniref:Uncharacterized protein n=1 Tax=hydrothermal vent metagenome TaxID=652676 RepID=A0A3B0RT12_9ZZZZ
MNWELIFTIANNYALVMWLILAFAPRREMVLKTIFYGGVGLLALTYAVIIVPLMTGLIEGGGNSGSQDYTTLTGVQALLSSDGGATIGWVHYLAFDLFVGIWVASNADRHGIHRIIQIPFLFLTLMLGPFGLILYLLFRFFRTAKPENAIYPG